MRLKEAWLAHGAPRHIRLPTIGAIKAEASWEIAEN